MKKIPVVFAINNEFAQHCGVAIASILYNGENNHFLFCVLHTQKLHAENINKLKKTVKYNDYESDIIFKKIKKKDIKNLPHIKQFSFEAYNRLFFAKLFPKITKYIYLDSDIVVESNLKELYNIKFKEPVAAVIDPPLAFNKKYKKLIGQNLQFFNSGVLIINTKKYLVKKIAEQGVAYLKRNKENIIFADQDALNYALKNNWFSLPIKWNVHKEFYLTTLATNNKTHNEEIINAKIKPCIIHYTTEDKPWVFWCEHPKKSRYYFYLQKTEWKHYRPPIKIKRIIKKLFNKTKEKIRNYIR